MAFGMFLGGFAQAYWVFWVCTQVPEPWALQHFRHLLQVFGPSPVLH